MRSKTAIVAAIALLLVCGAPAPTRASGTTPGHVSTAAQHAGTASAAAARKTYLAALKTARTAYLAGLKKVRADYQAAIKKAKTAYAAAKSAKDARKTYLAALKTARTAYLAGLRKVRASYQAAIRKAKADYAAAKGAAKTAPAASGHATTPVAKPPAATVKEFKITALQFAFQPSEIRVKKGDKVRLIVTSIDVTHGLQIPAFNVNLILQPNEARTAEFTADQTGTFPFFCSIVCGFGHAEMSGRLIVE